MYVLNGKVLQPGVPFNHKGLQYPGDWLAQSTKLERTKLGIKEREVPRSYKKFDPRFYFSFENPRALEDVKSSLTNEVNSWAGSTLSGTDWYIIRRADTGVEVPSKVMDWRNTVRAYHAEVESAIERIDTVEELENYWKNEKPSAPVLDV